MSPHHLSRSPRALVARGSVCLHREVPERVVAPGEAPFCQRLGVRHPRSCGMTYGGKSSENRLAENALCNIVRIGSAMRGRPLLVPWRHSAEELEALLAAERNPRRRQRLEALRLLRIGCRIKEVRDTLGVDYRTIQRWVAWYRAEGLDSVLQRTPGHRAPGRRPKLTSEQTQVILARYEDGQFRSVREVVEWVREELGVEFTYSGMYAHLRRARERACNAAGDGGTERKHPPMLGASLNPSAGSGSN